MSWLDGGRWKSGALGLSHHGEGKREKGKKERSAKVLALFSKEFSRRGVGKTWEGAARRGRWRAGERELGGPGCAQGCALCNYNGRVKLCRTTTLDNSLGIGLWPGMAGEGWERVTSWERVLERRGSWALWGQTHGQHWPHTSPNVWFKVWYGWAPGGRSGGKQLPPSLATMPH